MALIAILSAVTILSMAFYIPNLRLKSASQDINLQIRKARLEAIRQSRHCYVDFFRTVNGQVFSPFIWMEYVDSDGDPVGSTNYNSTTITFDPGVGDKTVFGLPVTDVGGEWELDDYRGIRFDVAFGDSDGVTFPVLSAPVKRFRLNTRGISNEPGSIYLRNARGRSRQVMVTLGGATRIL